MYDWSEDKVKDYIRNNSRNNFTLIEFTYRQLGRSEDWFEEQCRELNYDMFKINREILLQWNSASDLCPFTEEEIDRLKKNACDEIYNIYLKNSYPVKCYKDVDFTKTHIISVDCATGMAQDSSAIIVSDPDNCMDIVAEFNNNKVDTIEFAQLIYELCKKYFIAGPIVIERNSVGKAIIDFLRKTDLEPRLYYEYKEVVAERKITDIRKSNRKQMTRYYGVNTDKDSRAKMLDILRSVVNENYHHVNSKTVIAEIAGLERKKNGNLFAVLY